MLVNNAGVQRPYALVEMSLEEWERVLAVNLTGAFLCAREAARGPIDAGAPGVIVNVSSVPSSSRGLGSRTTARARGA